LSRHGSCSCPTMQFPSLGKYLTSKKECNILFFLSINN
jgi:hypothetical protein